MPCFILYSKAKFACYSRCFLTSYFCIPVPYSDQEHQTATVQEWRRIGSSPPPRSGAAAEKSYHKSEVRGGGREELPHPGGQGPGPRGASPPPRSGCCGSAGGTIVWAEVNNREGTQPYPSTGNCIKDLLSMDPPIRTKPNFPLSQSLPSGRFYKPLILVHQRADRLKTVITEN